MLASDSFLYFMKKKSSNRVGVFFIDDNENETLLFDGADVENCFTKNNVHMGNTGYFIINGKLALFRNSTLTFLSDRNDFFYAIGVYSEGYALAKNGDRCTLKNGVINSTSNYINRNFKYCSNYHFFNENEIYNTNNNLVGSGYLQNISEYSQLGLGYTFDSNKVYSYNGNTLKASTAKTNVKKITGNAYPTSNYAMCLFNNGSLKLINTNSYLTRFYFSDLNGSYKDISGYCRGGSLYGFGIGQDGFLYAFTNTTSTLMYSDAEIVYIQQIGSGCIALDVNCKFLNYTTNGTTFNLNKSSDNVLKVLNKDVVIKTY